MKTYRVIQISEQLRERIRETRTSRRQTNETLITTAVNDHLPAMVQALQALGCGTPEVHSPKARPARLPFDPATIDQLREASQQTGIPATDLLRLCLYATTKNVTPIKINGKPRKSTAKSPAKQSGPEQPQAPKSQTEGKKSGKRGTGKKGGTK